MPGVNWAKNLLLGKEMSAKEMEDIPFPRLELHVHVMYKTIEAGSILGMLVVGPLNSLIRKKPFLATIVKCGVYGAGFGVVAGPVMTEGTLYAKKATPESVWDRCYRLRYNAGQVRTDKFVSFCALGGATASSLSGAGPLAGAVIGIVSGSLTAGFVGNKLSPNSSYNTKPKSENKANVESKTD